MSKSSAHHRFEHTSFDDVVGGALPRNIDALINEPRQPVTIDQLRNNWWESQQNMDSYYQQYQQAQQDYERATTPEARDDAAERWNDSANEYLDNEFQADLMREELRARGREEPMREDFVPPEPGTEEDIIPEPDRLRDGGDPQNADDYVYSAQNEYTQDNTAMADSGYAPDDGSMMA